MPKISDLSPDSRFMALFLGRSGSGKTCAEMSWRSSEEEWIECHDFDGRIRGILGATWLSKKNLTYEFYPPRQKKGSNDPVPYNKIMDKLQTYHVLSGVQPVPITLVLDSLTSETYMMLDQSVPFTHISEKNDPNNPKEKEKKKGKWIGPVAMAGPGDYGFEAKATYDILGELRGCPVKNIIVSAHIVDRYGKDPNEDSEYADSIKIGEKLSIRDKIGENIQIHFDHVFKFERRLENNKLHFYCITRSDLARTAFSELPDEFEITGKNFYETVMSYVKKEEKVA